MVFKIDIKLRRRSFRVPYSWLTNGHSGRRKGANPPVPPVRPVMNNMDPDCAICSQPAMMRCECEAGALDKAVSQAEHKMMILVQLLGIHGMGIRKHDHVPLEWGSG